MSSPGLPTPSRKRAFLAAISFISSLASLWISVPAGPVLASPPSQPAAGTDTETVIPWSADERAALEQVRDRGKGIGGPALGDLLRRAGEMSPDAIPPGELDRPAFASLVNRPHRYRGEPVALSVLVGYTARLDPSALELDEAGAPRDVWRIDGFLRDAVEPAQAPVRVLSLRDPAEILPGGRATEIPGEVAYPRTPAVEVCAIFYKVYVATSRGDAHAPPRRRPYPLVVAWSVRPLATQREWASSSPGFAAAVPTLVLAMAALFTLIKLRGRRGGVRRGEPPRSRSAEAPEEQIQVDPNLQAVAEQYRRESAGNGRDSHGSSRDG